MTYRLEYSRTSRDIIRKIHPALKSNLRTHVKALWKKPYTGKKLERELAGYFSIRVQRFRIIYKVREAHQVIEIHYVGHRRDVYQLFSDYVRKQQVV